MSYMDFQRADSDCRPWRVIEFDGCHVITSCYACYSIPMETISHRELRNNSGQVLERVRNGDTIAITNHGELAALLVPPNLPAIDQLTASGRVREPRDDGALGLTERLQHQMRTEAVLDDLRGDR
jgi:prevent-host-death family protein